MVLDRYSITSLSVVGEPLAIPRERYGISAPKLTLHKKEEKYGERLVNGAEDLPKTLIVFFLTFLLVVAEIYICIKRRTH